MQTLMIIANVVCLVTLIAAIKNSQRRWLSSGYAALGFALVLVLGFVSMFFLVPRHGNVIDVNEALDKIARGVQIAAPIAAVWGAHIPPRRVQA
jgi:uncharacterized membrane protein